MDKDELLTAWDLDRLIDSTIIQYADVLENEPTKYDMHLGLRKLLLKLLKSQELTNG